MLVRGLRLMSDSKFSERGNIHLAFAYFVQLNNLELAVNLAKGVNLPGAENLVRLLI